MEPGAHPTLSAFIQTGPRGHFEGGWTCRLRHLEAEQATCTERRDGAARLRDRAGCCSDDDDAQSAALPALVGQEPIKIMMAK